MRFARLLTVVFTLTGCHFAVQGVGGGSGDSTGTTDPGASTPGTGSTPTLPDAPDLAPPVTPPPAGMIGDACDATHPCDTGLDCLSHAGGAKGIAFPAGYCSKNCSGASLCPSGSSCTDVDKQHVCLATCDSQSLCAGANSCCDASGGNKVCVPLTCGSGGSPGPNGPPGWGDS